MELPHEIGDVRLIAVVEVARRPHGELLLRDLNALLEGYLRPLRGLQTKTMRMSNMATIKCY